MRSGWPPAVGMNGGPPVGVSCAPRELLALAGRPPRRPLDFYHYVVYRFDLAMLLGVRLLYLVASDRSERWSVVCEVPVYLAETGGDRAVDALWVSSITLSGLAAATSVADRRTCAKGAAHAVPGLRRRDDRGRALAHSASPTSCCSTLPRRPASCSSRASLSAACARRGLCAGGATAGALAAVHMFGCGPPQSTRLVQKTCEASC